MVDNNIEHHECLSPKIHNSVPGLHASSARRVMRRSVLLCAVHCETKVGAIERIGAADATSEPWKSNGFSLTLATGISALNEQEEDMFLG